MNVLLQFPEDSLLLRMNQKTCSQSTRSNGPVSLHLYPPTIPPVAWSPRVAECLAKSAVFPFPLTPALTCPLAITRKGPWKEAALTHGDAPPAGCHRGVDSGISDLAIAITPNPKRTSNLTHQHRLARTVD
mmetsp:Transcript_4759/g.7164  ORF Transcript_4759/g.7164 Transcript_4759/m.7164 type:complete len:131 (+) Transcript_4759:1318-1710(+)